jgi:integrase/recombinase XerC
MDEALVKDFISYLSLQKRSSKHTVENYQRDLLEFFSFLNSEISNIPITEINHQHARSFMAHLIDEKKSPRTVNRKLSTLKSFFKFLIRNQIISINPMQKVIGPKTAKKLPVFIDEGQTEQLFLNYKSKDEIKRTNQDNIYGALHQFLKSN